MSRASGPQLGTAQLAIAGGGTLLLFLFSVRLLGAATEAAAPLIEGPIVRLLTGDASALGISWLATYGLMNGSVVAALAMSLSSSGLVSAGELYLLVAGSRLGAAAVVVLLGAIDYVHHRESTFVEATGMGFLAFLLTITVYVPATVLGLLAIEWLLPSLTWVGQSFEVSGNVLRYVQPLTDAITSALGPGLSVVLAIGLLFGSLWIFDTLLGQVETNSIRRYTFRHFGRPWRALVVGIVLTSLTTSVAFSLGVIVPLYNRGFVERDEAIPYILGANVGTLFDTLVVGLVLETHEGVAVVLLLGGAALAVTIVALLVFPWYSDGVNAAQDLLLTDRRYYLSFALLLVVVPLALLLG